MILTRKLLVLASWPPQAAQASLRRLAGRGGGGDDQVKEMMKTGGVKKVHPNIWAMKNGLLVVYGI